MRQVPQSALGPRDPIVAPLVEALAELGHLVGRQLGGDGLLDLVQHRIDAVEELGARLEDLALQLRDALLDAPGLLVGEVEAATEALGDAVRRGLGMQDGLAHARADEERGGAGSDHGPAAEDEQPQQEGQPAPAARRRGGQRGLAHRGPIPAPAKSPARGSSSAWKTGSAKIAIAAAAASEAAAKASSAGSGGAGRRARASSA